MCPRLCVMSCGHCCAERAGWTASLPPGGVEGRAFPCLCSSLEVSVLSLMKVFCLSPQSVPESAELKRVCAHVRMNWAMLEGEHLSLVCFSRVTFRCGHSRS